MIGEQEHVRLALAQRRHEDGKDIQAVVEILAELSLRDRFPEILVGGGHQAHVNLDRVGASQPLEFPLLQHAE